MKKQLTLWVTAFLLVTTYAVARINSTGAATQAEVSYLHDVQPILESRCRNCHFGEFTSADLHMDTYESLMAGSENGPIIMAGNAKKSLLVTKISTGDMPKRGPELTPAQIQVITDWINAGAQDN
jgi:uncharacterized membrane protein